MNDILAHIVVSAVAVLILRGIGLKIQVVILIVAAAGIGKELFDSLTYGLADPLDIVADAAGIAVGAVIAFATRSRAGAVHRAVRTHAGRLTKRFSGKLPRPIRHLHTVVTRVRSRRAYNLKVKGARQNAYGTFAATFKEDPKKPDAE